MMGIRVGNKNEGYVNGYPKGTVKDDLPSKRSEFLFNVTKLLIQLPTHLFEPLGFRILLTSVINHEPNASLNDFKNYLIVVSQYLLT